MAESQDRNSFTSQLLVQDSAMSNDQYRDYREKLTHTLVSAQRRERIAYWVCAASGVVSFGLMFVGGSGILGSFDPTDKDATLLSTIFGVIYAVSSIAFWLSLASFYSRFRPQTRQTREDLRDLQMLQLAAQVDALQKDVASLKVQSQNR